jgi:hypothetical protein
MHDDFEMDRVTGNPMRVHELTGDDFWAGFASSSPEFCGATARVLEYRLENGTEYTPLEIEISVPRALTAPEARQLAAILLNLSDDVDRALA